MPTRINCSSFGRNAACTHPEAPRCIVWLDSVGTPSDPRRPRGQCTLCTPFLRPADLPIYRTGVDSIGKQGGGWLK